MLDSVDSEHLCGIRRIEKKLREAQQQIARLEDQVKKYNFSILIASIAYAASYAAISFFTKKGIQVFSKSFSNNHQFALEVSLYVILAFIIVPSFGWVIFSYYHSYKKPIPDKYINLEKKGINNTDDTWKEWGRENWKYFKQYEIAKRYILCWSIHALSITFCTGIYYLMVKGAISIVTNSFPQPEWHQSITVAVSIIGVIALGLIDGIFYHSVQNMVWYKVPQKEYYNNHSKEMIVEEAINYTEEHSKETQL